MIRRIRLVLIAALIATLIIDPATACRFWGRSGGYYQPYMGGYGSYGYSSYGNCYPSNAYNGGYCGYDCGSYGYECSSCGYESSCGGCGNEAVVYSDDGCCGTTYEQPPTNAESPSMMEHAPAAQPKLAPEPPAMKHMPSTVNRPPQMETAPAIPPQTMPRKTEPMSKGPADFHPTMPREEGTSKAPSNDLFGPPAAPAEEKPAAKGENLFGPSSETSPPPAESNNDLFGPPAEQPKAPSAMPSEPAVQPSAPVDNSDLFGAPEQPATNAAPSDGANAPANDDLFGPPAEETTPPADDGTKADPAAKDDLFNSSGVILHEPGGLASNELRNWLDSTGQFSCRGRILRLLDGKVQLQKDNDRTTTVSLSRLSQNDLQFVQRQAGALRTEQASQTAQVDHVSVGK